MSGRAAEGDAYRTRTAVWSPGPSVATVVVGVLAVVGAAVALCTAVALYLSSWDFRPQDRSEENWRAIVGVGTSGYVVASCAVGAALVLLLGITPRLIRGRRLRALLGSGAVVLVAVVLILLALHVGLPVLEHANYIVEHPGIF